MKKVIGLFVFLLSIVCVFNYTYAASSYKASLSTSTITEGGSLNITLSATNATGRFNVSSSNTSIATVSTNSVWLENNTQTITVKAIKAGTVTISVVPYDVADSITGDDVTSSVGNKNITLTVKAKEVTNNSGSTTVQTPAKSTDATLKSLRLSVEGMSPTFNRNTTAYSLNVGTSVTSISVTASVNNNKAKYYVTGNTNLKEGNNTIKVVVTAEAGNTKTYTITVTKAKDPEKANASLHNLIISNATLNEEFTPENLKYTLKDVNSNVEKLEISAYPENTNATVLITGNDSLVAGENTVVIKVTAQDGITVKEYVLKFNKMEKNNIQENTTQNPNDITAPGEDKVVEDSGMKNPTAQKPGNMFSKINQSIRIEIILVVVYAVAIIELIQIIYLYLKLRSYKNK